MTAEFPDFHIPHAEKIEWMIETDGFAVEVVAPDAAVDPPRAGYTYTVGFPDHVGFPDVVVFGLTPVAARGLIGLVGDTLAAGTEIPIGAEVVGLLDNELRCCFAPIDLGEWARCSARPRRGIAPPTSRSCSSCIPIATASCPTSRASTSACALPNR